MNNAHFGSITIMEWEFIIYHCKLQTVAGVNLKTLVSVWEKPIPVTTFCRLECSTEHTHCLGKYTQPAGTQYAQHVLALTVLMSLPAQRTVGGSMSETPAARPYTPTRLTNWCPGSSAPPCPCREASTLSHSPVADPALRTTFAQTPTLYPRTPCTTTLTSTPPPMNTIWEPRPGRRLILYPVSEDTRTTTTWTQPQLTCTQPPVAPLTMTTGPDNACCPPGLTAHSTVGTATGRKGNTVLSIDGLRNLWGAFTGWNSFLLDKPCRIYLKELNLCVKHGHLLWVLEEVYFDLWTQMAIAPHQGTSYLSGADIEPANRGDRRDLSLTRTIPLITDWNWILFFCVGCTFWFALFLLLSKKPYVI